MLRVTPKRGAFGLSVGAGVSRGDYTWDEGILSSVSKRWTPARWGNAEVSAHWSRGVTQLRAFVGFSHQLTASDHCEEMHYWDWDQPTDDVCRGQDGEALMYTGVAVRLAMPLGV